MSTALTSLAIATGFERQYLVLKRLGTTPLGRPRLLGAKTGAVLVVIAVQAVVIVLASLALGWSPDAGVVVALPAVALATVAFASIGLLMAGTLRAEITLALANGAFIFLLLISGMIIPTAKLPGPMRTAAALLPSESLAHVLHAGVHRRGHRHPRLDRARPLGGARPHRRRPPVPLGVIEESEEQLHGLLHAPPSTLKHGLTCDPRPIRPRLHVKTCLKREPRIRRVDGHDPRRDCGA